jgi:hypothetical protein
LSNYPVPVLPMRTRFDGEGGRNNEGAGGERANGGIHGKVESGGRIPGSLT